MDALLQEDSQQGIASAMPYPPQSNLRLQALGLFWFAFKLEPRSRFTAFPRSQPNHHRHIFGIHHIASSREKMIID
jgi:hypothetical protein